MVNIKKPEDAYDDWGLAVFCKKKIGVLAVSRGF